MNTIWEKFIAKHNGAYLARDAFDDFCSEILNRHYPGKDIVSTNDYNNSNTEELSVVFLSKFFLDEFTNSRKGQIRKAFKSFINTRNKKQQKVYNWVFCAPYTLNDEELKWWVNWKTKATQKYSIEIEFFDGNHCLQLAKKYYVFDKWFLSTKEEEEEEYVDENKDTNKILKDDILFEFITDNTEDNDETEKNKDKITNISEIEESFEKQIAFAKKLPTKPNFYKYKDEYIRILEERSSLKDEEQAKIDKKNSNNNPFEYFLEINVDNIETLSIFHKAKSAEARKQYILALYYYEKYFSQKDFEKILEPVRKKIPLSIKKCQKGTEIFLNELAGDIYSEKDEKNKALICYEKAYKKDKKNKVITIKYYTLLADNYTKRKNYKKAIEYYQKAIDIEKN
ncbi:MAG: tetratricopeptide repeat protein, partial [Bacteroidota bacterium]|nr:tetratricopeptide repeat protein [Bacteroidota bacterium]